MADDKVKGAATGAGHRRYAVVVETSVAGARARTGYRYVKFEETLEAAIACKHREQSRRRTAEVYERLDTGA